MILAGTALGQIAFGGASHAVSIGFVELSAQIAITSQITAALDIAAFEITLGETGFPTVIDSPRNLLIAANNKSATLASAITAADLSITVTGSLSGWPEAGVLTLDTATATATSSEIVFYDGIAGQVITLVVRGGDDTTAKSFVAGSRVQLRHVARHHNVLAEAIIATQTEVFSHTDELATKSDLGHTHTTDDVSGLTASLDSKLPVAGGTMTGALTLASAPTVDLHAATKRYVDYVGVTVWNAKNYGVVGNGTTDDTAAILALQQSAFDAGGARIYWPRGVYLVGGPLIDPGGHNAQLPMQLLSQSAPSITIEWVGELAPPVTTSVQGKPTANNYSIIKSTLTGATGNASLIGGKEPTDSGTYTTNGLVLNIKDMVFECPGNPTFTCLDFSNQLSNRIENVLIYSDNLVQMHSPEPTNSNSYAIKLSPTDHSSRVDVHALNVVGFYTAVKSGELAYGTMVICACKVALEIPFAHHPTKFDIVGSYGNAIDVKATGNGPCAVLIDLLSLQDDVGFSSPWQARVWNIDDPGNHLHGRFNWTNVRANVGVVHDFTKNGGTNFIGTEVW